MKNLDDFAFACVSETVGQAGLTKREYACIHLGIPNSGDKELDKLIWNAQHRKIAVEAMNAMLVNNRLLTENDLAQKALDYSDSMMGAFDELKNIDTE